MPRTQRQLRTEGSRDGTALAVSISAKVAEWAALNGGQFPHVPAPSTPRSDGDATPVNPDLKHVDGPSWRDLGASLPAAGGVTYRLDEYEQPNGVRGSMLVAYHIKDDVPDVRRFSIAGPLVSRDWE